MKPYLFCLGSMALVVACASYPRPEENLANSMAAAQGAREAGATEVPEAERHLTLAQDEIEEAKTLMDKKKYERADYMALRAFYDAQLAAALAREDAANRQAEQTERSAQLRRSQLQQSQAQNQSTQDGEDDSQDNED